MDYRLVLLVIGISLIQCGTSDVIKFLEDRFEKYDKRVRPGSGEPTNIDIDVYVNSLSSISEISMDFAVNIYLRQRWLDPRLAFPLDSPYNSTLTLNYELFHKLWVPDLFFKNEKSGNFHDITTPNRLIQLRPDGGVLYSQRISLVLACDMLLHRYPVDNQTCFISMESYGYPTSELVFNWRKMATPIQLNNNLQLPEFNLTGTMLGNCTVGYTTGAFSCIYAALQLQRRFAYYLIQVYVPSFLIVLLSWVSFWIDIHAVPARISLGLLTVLTITTQASGVATKLPRVSYIKAIDVWMFTNTLFVFGAFIEYAIVNVLARKATVRKEKEKEAAARRNKQHEKQNGTSESSTDPDTKFPMKPKVEIEMVKFKQPPDVDSMESLEHRGWCRRVWSNKALLVDVISRVFFPLSFIVFNVLYWPNYILYGIMGYGNE